MTTNDERPGCLLSLLAKLLGQQQGKPEEALGSLPYRRKDYLLSKGEGAFFAALMQALGGSCAVFPKVRLADLVYIPRGTGAWQSHFNRVQSKHVDFVVCDWQHLRPLLAIELDDSSHQETGRQERDAFVNRALQAAGLPILHVRAQASYDPRVLAETVRQAMS